MSRRQACPCNPLIDYRDCCAHLHLGEASASSAEQLMRSRYSAFVLGLWDYVYATWHISTRPPRQSLVSDSKMKWLSLTVLAEQCVGEQASVEFVARYKHNGRAMRLHERSRFVRESEHWFYLDGELFD